MRSRSPVSVAVLLFLGAIAVCGAKSSPVRTSSPPVTRASQPSSSAPTPAPQGGPGGAFLPDTEVLARVDDHVIRVGEYLRTYIDAYPEFKPATDSLGRIEFLNTMINKEVMARVAHAAKIELTFEDRLTLRELARRLNSNMLFQRKVTDSLVVNEADVDRVFKQYGRDLHLREIQFDDLAVATEARAALLAKRSTWIDVAHAHRIPADAKGPDGDIGWIERSNFDIGLGMDVFDLAPGGISGVVQDPAGFHIFQAVAARPASRTVTSTLYRNSIRDQIREFRAQEGRSRLTEVIGKGREMAFDSTNLRWAASQFPATRTTTADAGQPMNITFDTTLPEIAPYDTGRVLVRYRGGQLSLGGFLTYYTGIPPLMRPNVNTPFLLRQYVAGLVLEPFASQMAVDMGLDRDSSVVAALAERRDQLMVDRLYQDSVETHVRVSPQQRQAYYDQHPTYYLTWPEVTFATFYSATRAGADSLAARLRNGQKAEAILRADSLSGVKRGSIQHRRKDRGGPYNRLLFEELRPGQLEVVGSDREGYAVIQQLAFQDSRQLSFKEADSFVAKAVSELAAEKLLNEFLERHKRDFHIEVFHEKLEHLNLRSSGSVAVSPH